MIGNSFAFGWEVSLIEALQAGGNPVLEGIAEFFTLFGEEALMIAVIGLFYWGFHKEIGKRIMMTYSAALMAGCMLKNVFCRRRPYMDYDTIHSLHTATPGGDVDDALAQGFSFPSLHANDAVTLYGSIAQIAKKRLYQVLLAVLILCIGLSRIYLGVHYPTDVLGGWALGAVALGVMTFVQKKWQNPVGIAAALVVLALPGWFFCISEDFYSGYGLLLGLLAAMWFEEKYVRFANTKSVLWAVLRTLGGVVIFAGLSAALKLPFPKELLESVTFPAHLIRTMRYAVSAFAAIGVYPLAFKKWKMG